MSSAAKSARQLTVRMKIPVVELSECILCNGCVQICPEIFRLNEAGYIEVIELTYYPESKVDDAVKYCPVDCIYWHEK